MKRNFFNDLKQNLSLQDLLNLLKSNLRIVYFLTLIFYLFPISYFIFTTKQYRGKLRIRNIPTLVNQQYFINGVKIVTCWDSEFIEYKPRIFENNLYINAIIKEINNQNFLSKVSYLIKDDLEQRNKKKIKNKFDYLKSNLVINFDPKKFNYIDIFVTNKDFKYVKKSLFYIDEELKKTINTFQQNLISSEIVILEKLIFELAKRKEFVYSQGKNVRGNFKKIIFDSNSKDDHFLLSKNNYKNNIISFISENDINIYSEYLQKLNSIRDQESCINVALVNNKESLSLHNQLLKSGEKSNLFVNSEPLFFYSNYRKFNNIRLVASLSLSFLMAILTSLLGVFFVIKINFKNKN